MTTKMSIVCLGVPGAGKTVFLRGLLRSLNSPINQKAGFYIEETPGEGAEFVKRLISSKLLYDNIDQVYPEATSAIRSTNFTLYYNQTALCDIEWLDYMGGLTTPGGTKNSVAGAEDKLFTALEKSSSFVILIDAPKFAEAINKSDYEAQRVTGIENLIRPLSAIEKKKQGQGLNFLVLLTQ